MKKRDYYIMNGLHLILDSLRRAEVYFGDDKTVEACLKKALDDTKGIISTLVTDERIEAGDL